MNVIAEIGSNFRDLADILNSIDTAVECGAGTVKHQWFSEKDLYGFGSDERNMPLDWIVKASRHAESRDVAFCCSVFSPEAVPLVDPFVDFHKVASSEITDESLLTAIVDCRKPVLVSTGGASIGQLRKAIEILGEDDVLPLYCEPLYPAPRVDPIQTLLLLRNMTERGLVGFSDHSASGSLDSVGIAAMVCNVLERHVNFIGATGPDTPHADNPEQFKAYVKQAYMPRSLLHSEPMQHQMISEYQNPHQRVYRDGLWVRPRKLVVAVS